MYNFHVFNYVTTLHNSFPNEIVLSTLYLQGRGLVERENSAVGLKEGDVSSDALVASKAKVKSVYK